MYKKTFSWKFMGWSGFILRGVFFSRWFFNVSTLQTYDPFRDKISWIWTHKIMKEHMCFLHQKFKICCFNFLSIGHMFATKTQNRVKFKFYCYQIHITTVFFLFLPFTTCPKCNFNCPYPFTIIASDAATKIHFL